MVRQTKKEGFGKGGKNEKGDYQLINVRKYSGREGGCVKNPFHYTHSSPEKIGERMTPEKRGGLFFNLKGS